MLREAEFVAPGRPALFAATHEGDWQLVGLERLGEVVARSLAHGLDSFLDAAKRSHHHDARVLRKSTLAQKLKRIAVGQMQVDQGEVEPKLGEDTARVRYRRDLDHFGSELAQVGNEPPSEDGVIFQQENLAPGWGLSYGSHAPAMRPMPARVST
jgi:hypothetical protein